MSTKGKSGSTKGKSIKPTESEAQHSGIKAGGELGVEKSGRTLGKLKAGANLGLETDALDDVKQAADDTLDNIKSGFKAARKKLSHLYDE